MNSVLAATNGINVVLDQRQLSSSVPLMFPVFEVWVSSQRQQCNGSKKDPFHHPRRAVMAFQAGNVFCPNRAGNGEGNNPNQQQNIASQSLPPR